MPFLASLLCGLILAGGAEDVLAETPQTASACENNPTHSFTIPAWAFDRGNAKTFTKQYADAGPMVAFGGESPVVVEYDIEFPATTDYRLRVQYAAAGQRPITLSLDGRALTNLCRRATGSWNTSGAAWEESAVLSLSSGKHTIKIERAGDFPHVMNLRFDSALPLPVGWAVQRPKARKLSDPAPAAVARLHEPEVNLPALRRAIEDLARTFGDSYINSDRYLARLAELESAAAAQRNIRDDFLVLQREALLANPLLDFQDLLLVKRPANSPSLGLPRNWESNCSLPGRGYDDELCVWSLRDTDAEPRTLFKPGGKFIGDVDLHWDADRVLFSMPGTHGRWQVFEMGLPVAAGVSPAVEPGVSPGGKNVMSSEARGRSAPDPGGKMPTLYGRQDARHYMPPPRQLTGEQPDVDSYDACYLPNDRIAFTSTAMFVGVPCVNGSAHVATLYVMDADGRNIRQLCFDQEHNWCPTVMNDGRVLYARWEYADTPHSNSRLLFTMNPDGTSQGAYLGSGSYWPNSFFYARPIPNHPTKVVSVIGGHHDHPRMGELVVFDPQQGRHEGEPAVQRIPGFGKKVEPLIRNGLTLESWPKFLHPWPLSEKYFLVACKPSPRAPWGIYLADVFDNLLPLKQLPDVALLEPIPLRQTTRPPVIPDRVNPARTDALVVLQDIYSGDGLRGVPRGTVKSLRLFTYHYAYQGMGGLLGVVGMDGPWDIKRVLGTVPVEADGSARFRVPANTPISIQPLDAEGKALQLMRSWMTAMPGETVQCTGILAGAITPDARNAPAGMPALPGPESRPVPTATRYLQTVSRCTPVKSNERFVRSVRRCCLAAILPSLLLSAWTASASAPAETVRSAPAQKNSYLAPSAVVASADGGRLYVACEATAEVLVFDTAARKVAGRIPVAPSPSGLALSAEGTRLYVTCAGPASTVCIVDTVKGKVTDRLAAGYQAQSPALSPDGRTLYVCNRFNNDVSVFDLETRKQTRRIAVSREPFSAAVTPDGRRLLVVNHIHAGRSDLDVVASSVSVIDLASGKVLKEIQLPNGSTLLREIRISPDGRHAVVAHILARFHLPTTQIERGWINSNAGSIIDLAELKLLNTVLFDNIDSGAATPWAVAWSRDSRQLLVTHAGTHELSVVDFPALLAKLAKVPAALEAGKPVDYTSASRTAADVPNDLSFLVGVRQRVKLPGKGPRSLAVAGSRAWVANYFSDTLNEVDLGAPASLPAGSSLGDVPARMPALPEPRVECVPLGAAPQMTTARIGESHFNDASLCFQGWQACSSCHSHDARVDGFNWDNLNDGIGNPKNAKSLLLSFSTPPSMWLGVRSNAHASVRAGIRNSLFTVQPPEVAESIDDYFKSLKPMPSPRLVKSKLSPAAERGKKLFASEAVGCTDCHKGALYTDLKLHDVGTVGKFDQPTDRFDTPSLVEIWRSGPYLHDGRAATIRDVLTSFNRDDQHGSTSHLTAKQIDDLVEYILSL